MLPFMDIKKHIDGVDFSAQGSDNGIIMRARTKWITLDLELWTIDGRLRMSLRARSELQGELS